MGLSMNWLALNDFGGAFDRVRQPLQDRISGLLRGRKQRFPVAGSLTALAFFPDPRAGAGASTVTLG